MKKLFCLSVHLLALAQIRPCPGKIPTLRALISVRLLFPPTSPSFLKVIRFFRLPLGNIQSLSSASHLLPLDRQL